MDVVHVFLIMLYVSILQVLCGAHTALGADEADAAQPLVKQHPSKRKRRIPPMN